jgi:hypothetical protein
VQTWCQHAIGCLAQYQKLNQEQEIATCESQGNANARCASAVAVTTSYDTCLADVDAMPCSAFASGTPSLPATCTGVVLVQ